MFELIEDLAPPPGKLIFTHTIHVELDVLRWYHTSYWSSAGEVSRSRVHELLCAVCHELIGVGRWAFGRGRINRGDTRGLVMCKACGMRAEGGV
jgi:hypothetical protein